MIIIILMLLSILTASLTALYSIRLLRFSWYHRKESFILWRLTQWFILAGTTLYGFFLLFYYLLLSGTAILKAEIFDDKLVASKALYAWLGLSDMNMILLVFLIPAYLWKSQLKLLSDHKERLKRLAVRILWVIAAAAFVFWANYDFFLSEHSILNRINYWPF